MFKFLETFFFYLRKIKNKKAINLKYGKQNKRDTEHHQWFLYL